MLGNVSSCADPPSPRQAGKTNGTARIKGIITLFMVVVFYDPAFASTQAALGATETN
jgi:hypothetical protein